MNCPKCKKRTDVKETRVRPDNSVRRRRVCQECSYTFTTYEGGTVSSIKESRPRVVGAEEYKKQIRTFKEANDRLEKNRKDIATKLVYLKEEKKIPYSWMCDQMKIDQKSLQSFERGETEWTHFRLSGYLTAIIRYVI